jgi:hypothetical protein
VAGVFAGEEERLVDRLNIPAEQSSALTGLVLYA